MHDYFHKHFDQLKQILKVWFAYLLLGFFVKNNRIG